MERLWEPNPDYVPLRPGKIDLREFEWNEFPPVYLPYQRLYTNLTATQLAELLTDAKKNHWQALDLRLSGLHSLPKNLWDLPDLRVLYLVIR